MIMAYTQSGLLQMRAQAAICENMMSGPWDKNKNWTCIRDAFDVYLNNTDWTCPLIGLVFS